MKVTLSLVIAFAIAVLAADAHVAAAPATEARDVQLAGPPSVQTQYGHIRSLRRSGNRFVLRFDPALWLGGTTANRAAVEDKVIGPGEVVPNDYYVRDESTKLLTYVVPGSARVTILTRGPKSRRIAVAELAQVVQGRNPKQRSLYDPGNHLGYWIRVATDRVRSLDQQYQP